MRLQKKTNKKPIIAACIIVVLGVVLACGYFWLHKSQPQEHSSKPADQTTKQNSDHNKSDTSTSSGTTSSRANHTQPESREKEKEAQPQYEGEDINSSDSLSGVITYSAVVGQNLVIRTSINQSLSIGTCQLTLSSSSKNITKSSNIVPNPSSSTCEGFDIPVSEIGSGSWNISIAISSGSQSGKLSGNVQI